MQEETRINIRFKVSNSGADDKWRKYSGWDWGVARLITRELEKIWRPDTIIQNAINQWKEKKTENQKEEERKFAKRIEEESIIKEMCQDLQRSIRVLGDQPKEEKVKLSKLVISPFTDALIDFFWFWNQFET